MALETVGGPVSKTGMSRLTTEHVYFPITTDDDLTGFTVSLAFKDQSTALKPEIADWVVGTLVASPDDPVVQTIRILIGPDLTGHNLTPPTAESVTYAVWVKIETGSEIIVRPAGTLAIR